MKFPPSIRLVLHLRLGSSLDLAFIRFISPFSQLADCFLRFSTSPSKSSAPTVSAKLPWQLSRLSLSFHPQLLRHGPNPFLNHHN
ncbi:hypothetical protein LINGRAHAP2_LOCUS11833 [Linum grandiflorum]